MLFSLNFYLFGQTKLIHLADLLKGLDKTWTLKIDTSKKKQKSLPIGGQNLGFLIFTKGKQEITYCVYKSLNNNIDSSIHLTQKLASCGIIGLTQKDRIIKNNKFVIFLSIYPCWSNYTDDAKKLIEKIFTKFSSLSLN